jgi:hypothetical protein
MFIEIPPGAFALFKPNAAPFGLADTADVRIQYWAFEE